MDAATSEVRACDIGRLICVVAIETLNGENESAFESTGSVPGRVYAASAAALEPLATRHFSGHISTVVFPSHPTHSPLVVRSFTRSSLF